LASRSEARTWARMRSVSPLSRAAWRPTQLTAAPGAWPRMWAAQCRLRRERDLPVGEVVAPLAEPGGGQGGAVLIGPDDLVGVDGLDDEDLEVAAGPGGTDAQVETGAVRAQPSPDAGARRDGPEGREGAPVQGTGRKAEEVAEGGVGLADQARAIDDEDAHRSLRERDRPEVRIRVAVSGRRVRCVLHSTSSLAAEGRGSPAGPRPGAIRQPKVARNKAAQGWYHGFCPPTR
jgi:hypothetical protein